MAFNDPTEVLYNEANKSMANSAINMVKQMAASLANLLVRGIAIFSDPLFRKNLGERYLNIFALMGVGLVWFLVLIASWPFGLSITGMIITRGNVATTHWVSMLVILAYGGTLIHLIKNDAKAAIRRHAESRPTHSYSYGQARLSIEEEYLVKVGLFVVFLFFAAPLAFVFLASIGASYLQGKLQAVELYGRYLDAIDAMIETEQLETALLGITPVGNTQLVKPLSGDLPDSLRKNIAAAAARNTVTGLAKLPQARSASNKPLSTSNGMS